MKLSKYKTEYLMEKIRMARETYTRWDDYFKEEYGMAACPLDDDGDLVIAALVEFINRREDIMNKGHRTT